MVSSCIIPFNVRILGLQGNFQQEFTHTSLFSLYGWTQQWHHRLGVRTSESFIPGCNTWRPDPSNDQMDKITGLVWGYMYGVLPLLSGKTCTVFFFFVFFFSRRLWVCLWQTGWLRAKGMSLHLLNVSYIMRQIKWRLKDTGHAIKYFNLLSITWKTKL